MILFKVNHYVGAMPGGKQRQANLAILLDRAKEFQKISFKGLFNFINFVEKLKSSSNDLGVAKILGENDNVVRIMSIHKSKGLEFPAVIIAGMGKQFNLRDCSEAIVFHKDLGFGPKYVNAALRTYSDTIAKTAIKNKVKMENLAEEMRILYVACTRAKDKLIMVGSARDLAGTAEKWTNVISPYTLGKGQNYLDWVCPVLMRHKDARALRELAEVTWEVGNIMEDDSKWIVEVIDRSHINLEEGKKKINNQFKNLLQNYKFHTTPQNKEFIANRLDWRYEHEFATKIPSKVSVSEIKNLQGKDLESMATRSFPALVKRPGFMEGKKKFTGAEIGTITHFVLRHLSLTKVNSLEEIEKQLKEMVAKELLKAEEVAAVDVEKLFKFFTSNLGKRILSAEKVYREVPFILVRKACEIIEGLDDCHEELLIQGVIDLYFIEGDELVLVDYKTDHISSDNRDEVIAKYQVQVELYKEALEKIKGRRVKESYLFLLDADEAVKV